MSITLRSIPFQGRHVTGAIITCGHCGATKTVPVASFKASEADKDDLKRAVVVRKLMNEGWLVGKKDSQHRCPGCYTGIKVRQKHKLEQLGNVVALPIKPEVPASRLEVPEPRKMEIDDRRIIFEKLNEHYVNGKTGYEPGWTDARVATDLGVPRAWVSDVRDQLFGPAGSNEEIRATIAEAQLILTAIKDAAKPVETVAEVLKTLLGKADAVEKKLLQIEKDLR